MMERDFNLRGPEKETGEASGFLEFDTSYDIKLLDRLKGIILNYPALVSFYMDEISIPARVFTPKVIDKIVSEYSNNSELYLEVISFVHTLSLIDILEHNGKGNGVFELFANAVDSTVDLITLSSTEVMEKATGSLNRNKIVSVEDLREDKEIYILIMSVYIFSSVCNISNIATSLQNITNAIAEGRHK